MPRTYPLREPWKKVEAEAPALSIRGDRAAVVDVHVRIFDLGDDDPSALELTAMSGGSMLRSTCGFSLRNITPSRSTRTALPGQRVTSWRTHPARGSS